MEDLYRLRSQVEHLHHPMGLPDSTGSETDNLEEWRHFFLRTYQAEEIARHCISSIYLREQLWPEFEDDASTEHFWKTKWADERNECQRLWGPPISLKDVATRFESDAIDEDNLLSDS